MKTYRRFSTAALRRHASSIFKAALKAADPYEAVLRHARVDRDSLIVDKKRYRLDRIRNIYVIGAGKATAAMARAIEKLLRRRITAGHINVKYGHGGPLKRIEITECGHPIPDAAGVAGSERIAALARSATADDLVICLISGGASALMPLPTEGLTLDDKQRTSQLLLDCGATIHEINAVRKHLSAIKGGQLAALVSPAPMVSLLLSDVIGDNLDVIGSGPAAPDTSIYETAWGVLEKYGITDRVPAAVRDRIDCGRRGEIAETPKPHDPLFDRVQNIIIGSNSLALEAAAARARELGLRPLILSSTIEGETRDAAGFHASIAREIHMSGQPLKPPCCIISGGETTVTMKGKGKGGRNQEFALAAAIGIAGLPNTVILSAGTDGTDGPTDAAGAVCDGATVLRANSLGLDAGEFLGDNDSYTYFDALDDLVITGPTGTNVMDVHLVLVG